MGNGYNGLNLRTNYKGDPMGEIVIEEINYKAFVLVLASLFLLIAASAIALFGIREDKLRYWLPGMAAAFLFLILFTASVIKAVKVKSLLTITRDGIIDNSSIGGVGFISFDEIKEFIIITLYNKKAIAVIPKNIDSFLSKLSIVKRRLVRRNLNLNLPPVTIHVDLAKDMEPEDILTLLQKRLADYSSLYE
jgi:hypothetical protein